MCFSIWILSYPTFFFRNVGELWKRKDFLWATRINKGKAVHVLTLKTEYSNYSNKVFLSYIHLIEEGIIYISFNPKVKPFLILVIDHRKIHRSKTSSVNMYIKKFICFYVFIANAYDYIFKGTCVMGSYCKLIIQINGQPNATSESG